MILYRMNQAEDKTGRDNHDMSLHLKGSTAWYLRHRPVRSVDDDYHGRFTTDRVERIIKTYE